MSKLSRVSTASVTVAAVAAVLAGCGGSDSTTLHGSDMTKTAAPVATKPAKDVVLTAAELQAGITTIPVTDAQLKSALDQLTSAADTLKATPSECGSKTAIIDATTSFDVSKFGMITGTSSSNIVAESVLAANGDIAKLRSAFTGTCKTMTADLDTQGTRVSTKITRTVLDVPKGKATDLLAVREDASSDVGGQQIKQPGYQGYAQVGGYAVTVSVKAMSGSADKALFEQLLTKAIDKAAQA